MHESTYQSIVHIKVAFHEVMDQSSKGDALVNDLGTTGRAIAVIGAQTEFAVFAVHRVSVSNRCWLRGLAQIFFDFF